MNERTRRLRRPYGTGDKALDARIAELVQENEGADGELLRELVTSCFRLLKQGADRGELKLVNAALKEFAYAFKVFDSYRGVRKVGVFGSARTDLGDVNAECAQRFGEAMAERGWMVITGAGPGIMEASQRGAGAHRSFGASIRLPMEMPNVVIEGDPKLINFKYFFTRKVTFIKESHAFALFPGGFGTMDEVFELLTLMQTGKSDLHPVVLLEAPGGTYWSAWRRFIESELVARGMIDESDMDLLCITDSVERAVDEIESFYRNYQSQRYVKGTLVLRVLRVPSEDALAELAERFRDILRRPGLRGVEPAPDEVADNDSLECGRIALAYNQRSSGRLRQLLDALNAS